MLIMNIVLFVRVILLCFILCFFVDCLLDCVFIVECVGIVEINLCYFV